MKDIREYITEQLVAEAKQIKMSVDEFKKKIDAIRKFNTESNISKLIGDYLTPNNDVTPDAAKRFNKKYWKSYVYAVGAILDYFESYVNNALDDNDKPIKDVELDKSMTSWILDTCANADLLASLEKESEEEDLWSLDDVVDAFNKVSTKVCKEAWLI